MQRRLDGWEKQYIGNSLLILLIVGFMTAVQYNSMKNPEERDTTGYLGNPP